MCENCKVTNNANNNIDIFLRGMIKQLLLVLMVLPFLGFFSKNTEADSRDSYDDNGQRSFSRDSTEADSSDGNRHRSFSRDSTEADSTDSSDGNRRSYGRSRDH